MIRPQTHARDLSKVFTSILTALCAFGILAQASPVSADVKFRTLTFEQAKKAALKEKKKVMVDFYTDWCGWCKVLDKKTYSDSAVGVSANKSFISIKIDAEKGEGIALAKKYAIHGYPTIMFFDGKGGEIDRVVGYQDAPKFLRSLDIMTQGGNKAILEKLKTSKGEKDAKLWLTAANYYAEQNKSVDAMAAYDKVLKLDMKNEAHAREEALFGKGFLMSGAEGAGQLRLATELYPERTEARQATMVIVKYVLDSTAHPEDVMPTLDGWTSRHPEDAEFLNFFAWEAAEKGIMLQRALESATRAIDLTSEPADRAGMMDTKAEVLSKMPGQLSEAISVEQQAIDMLSGDQTKNKNLRKSLGEQLTKFKAMAVGKSSDAPNIEASTPTN